MDSFKIISIDGGGIRGALSSRIIKRICDRYPSLLASTDLFAGTSTGALIALAYAYGLSADAVDSLYSYKNMKSIFRKHSLNPLRPRYSSRNLTALLHSVFPDDLCIGNLDKYVFIPSFNIKGFSSSSWQPVFFNNLSRGSTYNSKIIDAALASSAAPAYFPSHNNFIDGGVITNNPSIASVINTMKYLKPRHALQDFRVLSIGTGSTLNRISKNTSSWGALQWVLDPFAEVKTPIISILLNDGTLADLYCRELLGSSYMRIDPLLNKIIQLDDYKEVDYLKEAADKLDLSQIYRFIENRYLR